MASAVRFRHEALHPLQAWTGHLYPRRHGATRAKYVENHSLLLIAYSRTWSHMGKEEAWKAVLAVLDQPLSALSSNLKVLHHHRLRRFQAVCQGSERGLCCRGEGN